MEPPIPPDEADCCNSCCNPCILDIYETQLKKYNSYIANIEARSKADFTNCICETAYSVFKLIQIIQHTANTYFYTFEYVKPYRSDEKFDKGNLSLMYQPGQHFLIRGNLTKSTDFFTRAYTPIPIRKINSLSFTILIRLYKDGVMSRFIKRLKIGSETIWRGPYGDFTIDYTYQHLFFIAQGTGIAPIFSIIQKLLSDEECNMFLKLCYCCRNSQDILLRNELYKLSSHWNFNYEIFVTNTEVAELKYNEIVNLRKLGPNDLEAYLKHTVIDKRIQILICGSESFSKNMQEHVAQFNLDSSHIFIF